MRDIGHTFVYIVSVPQINHDLFTLSSNSHVNHYNAYFSSDKSCPPSIGADKNVNKWAWRKR